MDHADVRERLEDAALEPGALERLLRGTDADARAIQAHVSRCDECAREADALATTSAALAFAAPDSVRAPAGARARVLAAVAERGTRRRARTPAGSPGAGVPPAARRWNLGLLGGLATAAAVAVLVGAVLAGRDIAAQRDAALARAESYRDVVATTNEALRDPDRRVASLASPDGSASGSVLVSPAHEEVVMIASGLRAPDGDGRYRCFVERDGRRTQIGWMWLSGGLAWWAGPIEGVDDLGRPGDTLIVSLDPDGDDAALTARF